MNAKISNKNNENVKMVMGCYGIGVSRIAAAAIEQANDEKGIIWPKSIAPYEATIISIGYSKNDKIKNYSNYLYEKLKEKKIDILLDDRDINPGNMLSDSDLIGIPNKIIIGKHLLEKDSIELKSRVLDKTSTIIEDKNFANPSEKTLKEIMSMINLE